MNQHIIAGINICKNYKTILTISILFIIYIYVLITIDFSHTTFHDTTNIMQCKKK